MSDWRYIIPRAWLFEPSLRHENGTPYFLAMFMLSELWGRIHAPTKIANGSLSNWAARSWYAEPFGVTKYAVSRAAKFLEDGGLVRRSWDRTNGGQKLYLELSAKGSELCRLIGGQGGDAEAIEEGGECKSHHT